MTAPASPAPWSSSPAAATTSARPVAQTLNATGIVHKHTLPYRSQTNGKVERLNPTLLDEWAYVRPYSSNAERTEPLADFLHTYNYHRC